MSTGVAAIAVLVAAAVQSGVGFGFALVLAPVLATLYDPRLAVPTLAVLALVVNVMTLTTERGPRDVLRPTADAFVWASIPGMLAGAAILRHMPADALRILVAVVVLAAVAARLRAAPPRLPTRRPSLRADTGVGALSGALATSTGVNGPPLVLHLLHAGATPAQMRDTLAVVFVAGSVLVLAVLGATGGLDLAPHLLVLLGACAAGQVAGRALFARIAHRHEHAVLAVLVATALAGLGPVLRAVA